MDEKLKTIKIIHLAICVSVIIAYFILGNITSFDSVTIPTIDNSSVIYFIIPLSAILISNFLYKFQINKIDTKLKLEEKILHYQTASIIRWAIVEGAAFLILFLKPEFILFGIILILYLILIRPTADQFNRDVEKERL